MDDELFSNECGSSNFNNFLNLLGDCVQLKVILLLVSNMIVIIITMTISTIKFSTTITITSCCENKIGKRKCKTPITGLADKYSYQQKNLQPLSQGWQKYRGGLDVRGDMTGTHSVYTTQVVTITNVWWRWF